MSAGTHFIALGLVSLAVRYEYFIKVSPLSMTRVNALVLILAYADTPLKKTPKYKGFTIVRWTGCVGFLLYDV